MVTIAGLIANAVMIRHMEFSLLRFGQFHGFNIQIPVSDE
jgi:hypothetical protein